MINILNKHTIPNFFKFNENKAFLIEKDEDYSLICAIRSFLLHKQLLEEHPDFLYNVVIFTYSDRDKIICITDAEYNIRIDFENGKRHIYFSCEDIEECISEDEYEFDQDTNKDDFLYSIHTIFRKLDGSKSIYIITLSQDNQIISLH